MISGLGHWANTAVLEQVRILNQLDTKLNSKCFFPKRPIRVMIKAAPRWPFHIRQSGRQPALQGAGSGRIHEDEDDGDNDHDDKTTAIIPLTFKNMAGGASVNIQKEHC